MVCDEPLQAHQFLTCSFVTPLYSPFINFILSLFILFYDFYIIIIIIVHFLVPLRSISLLLSFSTSTLLSLLSAAAHGPGIWFSLHTTELLFYLLSILFYHEDGARVFF
jgi:hypothetical protein